MGIVDWVCVYMKQNNSKQMILNQKTKQQLQRRRIERIKIK